MPKGVYKHNKKVKKSVKLPSAIPMADWIPQPVKEELVTVMINVTRAGRTLHQGEFSIQTAEESFSMFVGKEGLVESRIVKYV